MIIIVGIVAVWRAQPFLFASLGPTAYMHAENPRAKGSRFYNTVVGQLAAIGTGYFTVWVLDSGSAPAISLLRVWTAVMAIALATLVALLLKAGHPPAGATVLLIALGQFRSTKDAIDIVIGVVIVAVLGEVIRRVRAPRA